MNNRNFPSQHISGNAGNMGPGERERRYHLYLEKNRLEHVDEEEI